VVGRARAGADAVTDRGGQGAARAAILARIRQALGDRPASAAAEYQGIAREYRQDGDLDEHQRIELFADRLRHYDVQVFRCERGALGRTIGQAAAARGKTSLVVPEGLPPEWLPAGIQWIHDSALSYADLDRSPGVLTACSVAIAQTGTIVLSHTAAEGRRALTLVPDYHLCVVRTGQIVQTVPEAIRLLEAAKAGLVTTISGPSATADIEMTRVRGVHGPRTLDVIIADGE
jgi:L-lactate dehydrogenase complex protein LldG